MRLPLRALSNDALLVLLLAALGSVLLAALLPSTFVGDSWMTLVAGREIADHGLPSTDHLTVTGEGRRWTDQQWLAQLILYGTERLGGIGLVALLSALCVLSAYVIAAVAARRRGGSMRATILVALPVVFAAPWTWTVRAQVLVLPLFAILLALLVDARDGVRRRTFSAVPLLVLWGNLHGASTLAAGLVTVTAATLVLRRRPWRAPVALTALAWIALFVTPYPPARIASYYRLMLIDPPFAHLLTEWRRPEPGWSTLAFGVVILLAATIVARRHRRLSPAELAILGVTLLVALQAVRGIYWFSLACLVSLPAGLGGGRRLTDRPGIPRVDRVIVGLSAVALAVSGIVGTLGAARRIEHLWPPKLAAAVAQAAAETRGPVLATSKHADWLLWRIPELRGRIAYDVRWEVYRREQIEAIVRFDGAVGDRWMDVADGYRVVLLQRRRRSPHVARFLTQPGWAVHYADPHVVVVAHSGPRSSQR